MSAKPDLAQRLKPTRFDRFGLDRLERELRDLLATICAYRNAIGDYGLGGTPQDATAEAEPLRIAPSPESSPSLLASASPHLTLHAGTAPTLSEGPLGETGWTLVGEGWLLCAPDGFRLRLNICERALLLALVNAADHAISFDAFFQLMATTRAVYGQKPLALSSMRMILMRLMKKIGGSTASCPIRSVHGWGYRLRVSDEVSPLDRPPAEAMGQGYDSQRVHSQRFGHRSAVAV
ncbi:hypothetical protein [Pseudacidovorax sp. RU35E]|uniref:hypothetical protein n=1 Tax=Pseudacidovorax sp. RU35E TaxID=1907403 RepID=UPI0009545645|nr:hypothetical protein [Pseudacidovorax sp. RU35E]SIR73167.1 hypothetical protein SAMN05880557_11828 [Pseudacidovorax sp. RU35E]